MDNKVIENIKSALNAELIQNLLVRYLYRDKGIVQFESQINPILIQDLPVKVPQLATKLEILPHAVSIDPMTNKGTLRWNLFVLGSHRMYLGETTHPDIRELARQIKQGFLTPDSASQTRGLQTPKRIIHFIQHVLERSSDGLVDINDKPPLNPDNIINARATPSSAMGGMPGGFR